MDVSVIRAVVEEVYAPLYPDLRLGVVDDVGIPYVTAWRRGPITPDWKQAYAMVAHREIFRPQHALADALEQAVKAAVELAS